MSRPHSQSMLDMSWQMWLWGDGPGLPCGPVITKAFIGGRQEGQREETGGWKKRFGDAGGDHEPGDVGGL